jgi:hypothetical protein
MKPGDGIVRVGVKVFQVLAWVSLVVQGLLGLVLLVTGGEPVPVGGVDIPARVVGVLNLVAAGIYFFMMHLVASVLQVLLEIRGQRPA